MSTFKLPSARLRRSLEKAQTQYATTISEAAGFLTARGITEQWAAKWGLGVATSPLPSHERFQGRLCIPYHNRAGVVALKFRCIQQHNCKEEGHSKYDQPAGQTQFIFNVLDLDQAGRVVHVTEGELDAIVLCEVLGEPVVGIPSAGLWQAHWPAHFAGFDRVVAWPDGDQAGREMGSAWGRKAGAEVISLPDGHDVNSYYLESGADGVRGLYDDDNVPDIH